MPLNRVSPGVSVAEIDQTTRAPAVSTSIGGFVGNFRWGPVEEITTVGSENEVLAKFGTPTSAETIDYHILAQFLSYSNNAEVVRAVSAAARNANGGTATDTVVKNRTNYDSQTFTNTDEGNWIAKYPGALGNSLKVEVFGSNATDNTGLDTAFASWAYSARFTQAPGTSNYASTRGATDDEIHVVVIDEDGLFTGTPGTVLEVFPFLSQASDAKDATGASIYFATYINNNSNYVWAGATDGAVVGEFSINAGTVVTSGKDFGLDNVHIVTDSLANGVDSGALTASEFDTGYALFTDAAASDVSILIGPDLPTGGETAVANDIIGICAARKDCVVTLSPAATDTTAALIKTRADLFTSSTYAIVDSGRLTVYDRFNDKLINIPASGSVAGLMAETDRTRGSFFSPAGFRRGQIRNVVKLAYNPTEADRDTLYKAGVNPIVTFPGEGTVLFGDKTHTGRPSAFDRINVRRLFILMEKSISIAARDVLFEFNNEFTRSQFINIVEPFLRTIQGQQGITNFAVVCDETNNTGDVIDRNEFVADIYVQPARSINFIQLNFIATRTGVSFETIVS
jgi:phage tail sheath protein FI